LARLGSAAQDHASELRQTKLGAAAPHCNEVNVKLSQEHITELRHSHTDSKPQHQIEVSGLPSHLDHLTPQGEPHYPINRRLNRPQNCSGQFGEKKNLLPMSEITPKFLKRPAHSLHLPYWLSNPGSPL
jgi:hypothetical protein